MRTIAFLNQKGGVGKSVSAATFARCIAADHGKRVLCIDADFQGSLSQYFGVEANGATTWELLTEGAGYYPDFVTRTADGVDVIPADMTLARADMPDSPADRRGILNLLEVLAEDDAYDYCLIDCHPYMGALTQAALLAADDVIVPVRLDLFSTAGMSEMLRQVRYMQAENRRVRIAGVLCVQSMGTAEEKELHENLLKVGLPVFQTAIRMSRPVMRSVNRHESLFKTSPRCGAAVDYRRAVAEYLKGVGA